MPPHSDNTSDSGTASESMHSMATPKIHNRTETEPDEADHPSSIITRLEEYNERLDPLSRDEREKLIPALAWKAFHLPGNGWYEDLFQYISNNHPLFSIFCHHPLHPIKWPVRLLNLAASVVFGLLITNAIWLFFEYSEDRDAENPIIIITLSENGRNVTNWRLVEDDNQVHITEEMLVLWSVGGLTNAVFDNTIWYMTACVCCLPGQTLEALASCRRFSVIFIAFAIVAMAALASFLVVLRATLTDTPDLDLGKLTSMGINDDEINPLTGFDDKASFEYLLSFGVELVMSLLVYFPVIATILFSGILGCGRVPVLGGRPYEVFQEELKEVRAGKKPKMLSQHNTMPHTQRNPVTYGSSKTTRDHESYSNSNNV